MGELTKDPKEIKKKVEKAVITSKPSTQKRSEIKKFADGVVNEDLHTVKNYILLDVLIPAAKKAISDIVVNGIDILLYGEAGRSSKKGNASRISYREYYDRDRRRDRDRESVRAGRGGYEYDEIIFDNRGDAEIVLSAMEDIIDQYDVVSVGDLYDLANVPNSNYGIHKYGWDDLSRASVVRNSRGYVIKLPRAKPL